MTIVLATKNKKKVAEMSRMFAGTDIRFVSLDGFPDCPDVIEDGKTFRANAVKKAIQIAAHTRLPAMADDSGLEVETLGKQPGIYSARYAGAGADDHANVAKLLRELRGVKAADRAARFVCCIAFALPDGHVKTFTGYAEGFIGTKLKGDNGFGYDPVFYPLGRKKTFAEMSGAEKDELSHRGKAVGKFCAFARKNLQS